MNIAYLLMPKIAVSYIYDDSTIRQGLEKMNAHGFAALPVLSHEGKYIGTVTEGDFLWHILSDGEKNDLKTQEKFTVADIIRKNRNPCVRINAGMSELLDKVVEQNFVPVVDDRDMFMGIVTRKDVLNHFRSLMSEEQRRMTAS